MKKFKDNAKVIVVDLDGTLTPTDTLFESLIILIKKNFLNLFNIFFWLLKGKANFKSKVSENVKLDVTVLTYNIKLINFLKKKRLENKKIILCTAANEKIAYSIANYLNIFDEVIASNSFLNNSGIQKRKNLDAKFGFRKYDYIGNSKDDLVVWAGANNSIIVNSNKSIISRALKNYNVSKIFNSDTLKILDLFKFFRIHQWLKNLLIFVPILSAHQIDNIQLVKTLIIAFFSFSFCASSSYILNDLFDLENDRKHPRKRNRPLASSKISIKTGIFFSLILIFVSLILASYIGNNFLILIIIYFLFCNVYSIYLKSIYLVDCLILSIFYILRLFCGAIAIKINLSIWLLFFSFFIFLSLAIVKRYNETRLRLINNIKDKLGRGYSVKDTLLLKFFGIFFGYVATLILIFYAKSSTAVDLYQQPSLIWIIAFYLFIWINWIWIKASKGQMDDDPVLFAIKDKITISLGILSILTFIVATVGLS